MNKNICTIGFSVPGYDEIELAFNSQRSLMDFDIILFASNISYYEQDISNQFYLGKRLYNSNGSSQLKSDIAHWKRELNSALMSNKTIFFFLSEKESFYLDTGKRSYSGTGK